ncbi:hypothetical protein BG015_002071 [Linnemannia schmuckeri]|uniref:Uncharacterized protein n=1 Tax=Linnemannia schmuckeri TaxID=64567 RepID=A0A9P5RSF3_9FUNG|nr:hypothetical protein BG015_002071 [Linnemannia schmuckeri]
MNTSKTCVLCFKTVQMAKVRRPVEGGGWKTVSTNGATMCVNPHCIGRLYSYTIRPRDTQAATAIAISGASIILSPTSQSLGPFSRMRRPLAVTNLMSQARGVQNDMDIDHTVETEEGEMEMALVVEGHVEQGLGAGSEHEHAQVMDSQGLNMEE